MKYIIKAAGSINIDGSLKSFYMIDGELKEDTVNVLFYRKFNNCTTEGQMACLATPDRKFGNRWKKGDYMHVFDKLCSCDGYPTGGKQRKIMDEYDQGLGFKYMFEGRLPSDYAGVYIKKVKVYEKNRLLFYDKHILSGDEIVVVPLDSCSCESESIDMYLMLLLMIGMVSYMYSKK
jgi:hypothetical protein